MTNVMLKRPIAAAVVAVALSVFAFPAASQDRQADPATGTNRTLPAKPTGGGPTSGDPAPAPPAEQSVILPSASGHTNSAAPTMHRNCDAAPAAVEGAPTNATDPCRKPVEPGDKRNVPEMSK